MSDKPAASFVNRLRHLAMIAEPMHDTPEWREAVAAMREGREVPPADVIAPAWLPGVSDEIMGETARDAARYVAASIRMREAQAELARLMPYYPRRVRELTEGAGYREESVHLAWSQCDRERHAAMRHRAQRVIGAADD